MKTRIALVMGLPVVLIVAVTGSCGEKKTVKSPSADKKDPPPPPPPRPGPDAATGKETWRGRPPPRKPETRKGPKKRMPLLSVSPSRSFSCRKDADCVFKPPWPCSCPPCGRVKQEVINTKELARLRGLWARIRCEMPACARCPHAKVTYVYTKAICKKRKCRAR